MTKRYIRLVYLALMSALIFPVITLWVADSFSPNVTNGVMMVFVLAIFVGLSSARYTISWLIIILTTIAAGFLLLGYVVMPTPEKIILVIAFPIEASLLSVIRHHLLHWNIGWSRDEDVQRHIDHYDLNVKLQTGYNANKFYKNEIKQIENYTDWDLWTNVELIRWDRHQQIAEYHPEYHAEILRKIAKVLKDTRLKNEFIYYMGDGMFLIISPQVSDDMYQKLNQEAHVRLQALDVDIPLMLKVATQRIDKTNCKKFVALDNVMKHLERGLETDIIVEYLKDDQND